MDEEPHVTEEFIETQKQLVKTSKKTGGPYTGLERANRRKEVYRLHFEHGMPAVKIADMMGVNKGTIYSDIDFLYREVGKEWLRPEYEDMISSQMAHLIIQRERIISYLEEAKDLQTKLAIEGGIADLDWKIMRMTQKIYNDMISNHEKVLGKANEAVAAAGLDYSFTSNLELIRIPKSERKKLDEIVRRINAATAEKE